MSHIIWSPIYHHHHHFDTKKALVPSACKGHVPCAILPSNCNCNLYLCGSNYYTQYYPNSTKLLLQTESRQPMQLTNLISYGFLQQLDFGASTVVRVQIVFCTVTPWWLYDFREAYFLHLQKTINWTQMDFKSNTPLQTSARNLQNATTNSECHVLIISKKYNSNNHTGMTMEWFPPCAC
jgi:hypothetical protein